MLYAHPHGNVFYRSMNHARPRVARGEGLYLFDDEGKRYLDGSGGPFVVNIGHGRKEVHQAMQKQLEQVSYVHAKMFTSQSVEEYAAALDAIVPIDNARFYFLSSGSEVIEAALKLARQIQQSRGLADKHIVISRRQSYHGMTFGALAATGRQGLRNDYEHYLQKGVHVSTPYHYRDSRDGNALAQELDDAIVEAGPNNVAAFLAEPISGASLGAALPDDDYWPAIKKVCERHGVLLIADEVLVGLGRCGTMWALDHYNTRPDILVCAKGCASGYFPLGFVAASHDDVESIRLWRGDFNHGGTFSHHALGAAAGLATLKILQDEDLVSNAKEKGRLLFELLNQKLGEHEHVGDIRGRGLLAGVELVKERSTKGCFDENVAAKVQAAAFEMGLISYYGHGFVQGKGDVVMLGPPLIIDDAQVHEMVDIFAAAIDVVCAKA